MKLRYRAPCPHCRAREALEAVDRALATVDSSWRQVALKKSRAHWQREMDKHNTCLCAEGEAA